MSIKTYSSPFPAVPTFKRSIFTHLFSIPTQEGYIGAYPANHPAFIDAETGTVVTRQQLKHHALSFGYGLRHHPQLNQTKRGDTLLIYLPNSIAFPVVLFGGVAAGLKCSPANSAYTGRELAHQYVDSGSHTIVTNSAGLEVVWEMFDFLSIPRSSAKQRVIIVGPNLKWAGGPSESTSPPASHGLLTFEDVLGIGALAVEEQFADAQSGETCYVCYSSGTTGKPKGVETTHANLTTVVEIGRPALVLVHGQDRVLGVLPFFHIYGAVALLHVPIVAGVPVIVQTRFEPATFCGNIERYRITTAMVVPPVLVVLARHPAIDVHDLSSLRLGFSAAAPLGANLINQVIERFRKKGVPVSVVQGYGLTETSPISNILPKQDALRKAGSIGVLLPNLEARIVTGDDERGYQDVLEGQPGELWIRGPTIMKGYLNNTKATIESITPDGWFKSGDVCERDSDGYYWIVDRRKELIKYKGFQVPPSELESVLLTHPDIADAAVIGVEDANAATELPRAYVVPARNELHQNKGVFSQAVKTWMETKVASHKYLRGGVVIIAEIPKSAAGKILRRELRERAKQEFTAEPARTKL